MSENTSPLSFLLIFFVNTKIDQAQFGNFCEIAISHVETLLNSSADSALQDTQTSVLLSYLYGVLSSLLNNHRPTKKVIEIVICIVIIK